jgi:hypothetical protein
MGIEEFMMYYGQQELQKIQKEEMKNLATDESGRNSDLQIGGGLLSEDFLSDDDESPEGRKSMNPNDIDVDELKLKIRQNSIKKKRKEKSIGLDT